MANLDLIDRKCSPMENFALSINGYFVWCVYFITEMKFTLYKINYFKMNNAVLTF